MKKLLDDWIEQYKPNDLKKFPTPKVVVCLNKDFRYVVKNIVCDDDQPSLDPNSSWIKGKKMLAYGSYFVPDYFVFDIVQKELWRNEEFKKENEAFLYDYQDE